ncbi:glycosyltransferase family 2 protein [Paenibacillus sp. YN15]|uniref:glycosyltransferase family 2 protein n=1 Tax=Paenibacillus sp. YN15 TaxID=1742774 RepID=UPI000DCB69DC|nr:glycosyltransferase family 2 protein [Paenibacillus sp. YN15]RAV01788.1 glycosyltransferase [Paenibacillus sp. YN15]
MAGKVRYSVVIPMYNEEEVIEGTYRRLKKVMSTAGEPYELLFVNDGSRDRCAEIIREYAFWDSNVRLLEFSRNFGHQVAITAGMDHAAGDAVILIDADLQDPPELILRMIAKWKEGYDVVYAQRLKRKGETWFKRATASAFYRVLRTCTDTPIPVDTGDFRLMDRRIVDEMKRLPEKNRFVRGLVSWVGFRQTAIEYEREERLAGETKYPFRKMMKLCLDGITSFSSKPLKLAGYAGALMSAAGFVYLVYILCLAVFTDSAVKGWTSLMGITLLLDGVILLMMGILGEYVGRIYDESKNRPLYILKEGGAQEKKPEPVRYRTVENQRG